MRPRGPGESALLLLDAVEVLKVQGTKHAAIDLQDAERAVAAGFGREASASLESILDAELGAGYDPTGDL
jgi:hypothetical protein